MQIYSCHFNYAQIYIIKNSSAGNFTESNVKGKILRACELNAGHLQTKQTEMFQKQSFEHKLFYSKMSLVYDKIKVSGA